MKYNSTLSAAFIRFLTTATATTSATSVAARLTKLEDTYVKESSLKTIRHNAKDAKATADKVESDLKNYKNEVNRRFNKKG